MQASSGVITSPDLGFACKKTKPDITPFENTSTFDLQA